LEIELCFGDGRRKARLHVYIYIEIHFITGTEITNLCRCLFVHNC